MDGCLCSNHFQAEMQLCFRLFWQPFYSSLAQFHVSLGASIMIFLCRKLHTQLNPLWARCVLLTVLLFYARFPFWCRWFVPSPRSCDSSQCVSGQSDACSRLSAIFSEFLVCAIRGTIPCSFRRRGKLNLMHQMSLYVYYGAGRSSLLCRVCRLPKRLAPKRAFRPRWQPHVRAWI